MGIVKYYLVAYNAIQAAGWSYILAQLCLHYANGGRPEGVWPALGRHVALFQYAAVLEIVHALLNLVKTPFLTTLIQVFSRVALVTVCIYIPDAALQWPVSLMIFAWALTEVIRYSFYAFNQFKAVPYVLGWLRYTLFIVLYPMGVTGETMTLWNSLDYIHRTQLWSISMPNSFNFAFSLYHFVLVALVVYVPGLPWLYSYMLSQRARFIKTSHDAGTTKKTA
eukprot:TRINITY_DN3662_c0_g2_i5.p1 TRINITY_DN3662_c0_g2~~TRINITY_DN3662_c0_g2_i5.p1  ORF type:complete len:223 (+),score=57.82 TRINITY_DN3662_c0_g2_i5:78-746(+)